MNELLEASRRPFHAEKTLQRIESLLREHQRLGQHVGGLRVSIANSTVILHGALPSDALRQELIPTIRRGGILWRVDNHVGVQKKVSASNSR